MGRGWLAALAGALLAAPGAALPEDDPPGLDHLPATVEQLELRTLLFPRDPPVRLLRAQL
ncbi:MAG: hypothetical protein RJA59_427, partial [Pseudomonadota bacterium]